MAASSFISLLTGVGVIAICAANLYYGAVLTRYEASAFERDAASAEAARNDFDFVGLRGQARRALAPERSLAMVSALEIEDVLRVEPTNGVYWLALARRELNQGAPRERVVATLGMSEIVQPREAKTMALRATFVIESWDALPSSDRTQAVTDIVELGDRLPSEDRELITNILKAKPEPVRASIRDAFLMKTRGERHVLEILGL